MDAFDSEALRFIRDTRRDPFAALIARDAFFKATTHANAGELAQETLTEMGYATTPDRIAAMEVTFRKQIDFWAGSYELFVDGHHTTTLSVQPEHVFDGRVELKGVTFRDDRISWSAEGGNSSSARLRFSAPPEGKLDLKRYIGPLITGEFWRQTKDAGTPTGGGAIGKVGVYSDAAGRDVTAVDPLESWSGRYELSIAATPPVAAILEIDGTTSQVLFNGVLVASPGFQSNVLTWSQSDGNRCSVSLEFRGRRGAIEQRVSGYFWTNDDGQAPAVPNVLGQLASASLTLDSWTGQYAAFSIDSKNFENEAGVLSVQAAPLAVIYDGVTYTDCEYSAGGNLIVWKKTDHNPKAGALAFSPVAPPTPKSFSGSVWDSASRPATNNLRGTFMEPPPPPTPDPVFDSRSDTTQIVSVAVSAFAAIVAAALPVMLGVWIKRKLASEAAARGAADAAARANEANQAAGNAERHAENGAAAVLEMARVAAPALDANRVAAPGDAAPAVAQLERQRTVSLEARGERAARAAENFARWDVRLQERERSIVEALKVEHARMRDLHLVVEVRRQAEAQAERLERLHIEVARARARTVERAVEARNRSRREIEAAREASRFERAAHGVAERRASF